MAEPLPAAGRRRYGVGLRGQIMVALGVGFALSVALLGLVTAELGERAVASDRQRAAGAVAEALCRIPADRARSTLQALVEDGAIEGARWQEGGVEHTAGRIERPFVARERGAVRVAVSPIGARTGPMRSLSGLLFLYVGITAAFILLLGYVLLTRLIVRPVEQLTRASERIARERGEVRVPIQGAAEVARLAVSFNEMQRKLSEERASLEARLVELTQATEELEAAQRSLVRSEKMASVGRLAAGIAHEIGNPLTSILGLVELVEDGGLEPDEQREFLSRVRRETERIHRIIRDLLDFARAEPPAEVAEERCDLVEVVEDAVRLVGPQKDLRQITLERRFVDPCPPAVGAASRLAQVVLNLLLNAADAMDSEGTIRLEVSADDTHVELAVSDTGPGIDPAIADHLFDPFVTTKPAGEGTGLGLAVCHTLVEQLGGSLDAENAEEGGARFTVRLPRADL
ncbi:MAG: sensor histidine kinase [Sandaracinaceae bacterium]